MYSEIMTTILIIDDETNLLNLVEAYLKVENYTIYTSEDGVQGLAMFRRYQPDLVILDVMLPKLDGFEVLQQIRRESDVYVLMLTARSDETDRVIGLTIGADDYLTKPFSPRELVARVKAILRRIEPRRTDSSPIRLKNLTIDPARRIVKVDEIPVDLRTKEFDLLLTLIENKGIVLSREKLLEIVWGFDFYGETRTVDVHIAHLRHKLKGSQATIETVWSVGYKLED